MKTSLRPFAFYATLAGFFALASFAQEPAAAPDAPKPAGEKSAAADTVAPAPAPAPESPAVEPAPAAPLRRLDSPEPGTPSGNTRVDDARQRADDARQRAEQARQRAAERADQDRARMRERNAKRTNREVSNVFADSFLPKDEAADNVVAVFGSTTSNGDVVDSVVAVFGNNQVTGPVGNAVVAVFGNVAVDSHVRTVVAIFGNVKLGPNAVVDEEVVCVAGTVERDPQAIVRRHVQNIGRNLPFGDGLKAWFTECLLKGRLLAFHHDLKWAWGVAFSFLAFYAFLALIFREGIEKCARTLESRPGASVLTAVCTVVLTPVALVVLCITIVGIVVVPFLGMGLTIATYFGKAVMLAWLGRRFTKFFGDGPLGHPAFAVLAGGLLVLAIYTVPVVGFLTYKLLSWLGLGVVVFTLLQAARRKKPAVLPVNPSPVAPSAVATGIVASPPVMDLPPLISAATMPRAGFWIRLAALVLDGILVAVVCGFLASLFPREAHIHIQADLLPSMALYGALMWKLRGTTIGGIVCGLKVVRIDGREIDWPTAIVRAFGCFLSLIVIGLGFIWVAIDDDRQSWHDKIAGTTVVRVPQGVSLL